MALSKKPRDALPGGGSLRLAPAPLQPKAPASAATVAGKAKAPAKASDGGQAAFKRSAGLVCPLAGSHGLRQGVSRMQFCANPTPLAHGGGGHVGVVRDTIQTTQYLGFEGSGVLIVSC